jgi:hypothetical protein
MTSQEHWFDAANPLTEHLPIFPTIEALADALRYDPLVGVNVSALGPMERDEWLAAEKVPLSPTTTSIKAALTIIAIHRHSLRLRNPTLTQGRILVASALEKGRIGAPFVSSQPMPGAALYVIKGITGLSKTVTVKHTLRLLGPQVIYHGEVKTAHWNAAPQLNYLFVPMSHDGSRGGLLIQILLAVDRALGTDRASELPRKYKTIERLAGAVIGLLHSLYLGVLVIDEIQLLNLVLSDQAEIMQLFLLNLANSGIPLVLVGNPAGFSWLGKFTQNLSRSVERAPASFHPCGAMGGPEDDEWDTVFEGIHAYYLLGDKPTNKSALSSLLKRRGGGIPRCGLALWTQGQRNAALDGRSMITLEDIDAVYHDESFEAIRPLCEGFANRDPLALFRWQDSDVPVQFYAQAWGKPLPQSTPPSVFSGDAPTNAPQNNSATKSATRTKRSAAAAMKAQATREANRKAAAAALTQTLSGGDMRMEGIKAHTLASFSELMSGIDGSEPNSSRRGQ